jgi:drug/metabolite transporter (DMT)-like permease
VIVPTTTFPTMTARRVLTLFVALLALVVVSGCGPLTVVAQGLEADGETPTRTVVAVLLAGAVLAVGWRRPRGWRRRLGWPFEDRPVADARERAS